MRHALLDRAERAPVEEVGRVHGVARAAQLVREGVEPLGLAHRVVEEQHLGHLGLLFASALSPGQYDQRS